MTEHEQRPARQRTEQSADPTVVEERRAHLAAAMALRYPEWRTEDLKLIGAGLEFLVFRSDRSPWGPVAVRVPLQRWISNDNDPSLDARELLDQEAFLLRFTGERGLGTPTVHALHFDDRCDFLVTELVESDDRKPDPLEIGTLARRLHSFEPPSRRPVLQSPSGLASTLARRIHHRVRVVERIARIDLSLPPASVIEGLLSWPEAGRSLLHMDLRPANLLVRPSGGLALVDWSNALVGDPAVEQTRISELGHRSPAFLSGYGMPDPLDRTPDAVETLYRFDAALMLAVVFLSEAPDPKRGRDQTRRVTDLADMIRRHA